jgi:uncharacterized RDD family membrane protein YckC
MQHFMMDCYYQSTPVSPPVLRESVEILAPARLFAIEEARRRAQTLCPRYFELRDLSRQFDNLFYNSETGET